MTTDANGIEETVVEVPAAPAAAPAAAAVVSEAEKFQSNVQPAEEETLADEPTAEEPSYGTPVAPYVLEVADDVPLAEHTPERMEMVTGFADVAAQSGIPGAIAQQMLDAAIDVAVGVPYSYDPDYTDADDAVASLTSAYGDAVARSISTLAQRYSKRMGPAFQRYLDSGPGNDVSVITTLALAETGTFRMSPAEAQAAIDDAMSDPQSSYNSTDPKKHRLAVAEVAIWSKIAHRDATQFASSPLPPKPVEPRVQTGATSSATVRETINKMLGDKTHALNQSGHRDHEAALKTYLGLVAKL